VYPEDPGGRLAQLESGAEFTNGEADGGRGEVGRGNNLGNNRVAKNGLGEDDGGMGRVRDAGVLLLHLREVEGERSGGDLLRLPVVTKGIGPTGRDSYNDCHELMAQRNRRTHRPSIPIEYPRRVSSDLVHALGEAVKASFIGQPQGKIGDHPVPDCRICWPRERIFSLPGEDSLILYQYTLVRRFSPWRQKRGSDENVAFLSTRT
jgi:hypothetical protein